MSWEQHAIGEWVSIGDKGFDKLVAIASDTDPNQSGIFEEYSLGNSSNRDWVV